MIGEERKGRNGVSNLKEKGGDVAAFFDLDGTLMPLPSLEMRFFSLLRYRRLRGARDYLAWTLEAVRLVPRGLNQIRHANKMHFGGLSVDEIGSLRMPSPYGQAMERVTWHAQRSHLIVLVSGTLEPLAARVARALETELAAGGLASEIRVCATRLEVKGERWTGRIAGEAMFGEAKARAIRRIAAAEGLDLQRCFAYGDSSSDKCMFEAVGKPAAVNPSNDLACIARRNEWPVLSWGEETNPTQRTPSARRSKRPEEADQRLPGEHVKSGYRV